MEGHLWSVALVLESYFRAVVGPVVGFASGGLSVRCGGGGVVPAAGLVLELGCSGVLYGARSVLVGYC